MDQDVALSDPLDPHSGGDPSLQSTADAGSARSERGSARAAYPSAQEPEARMAALEEALRAAQDELDAAHRERTELTGQVALAAEHYRTALLAAAPEVPPELVTGATVAEIDRSLAAALGTVDAVQRRLSERAAAERVPAGAPVRVGTDLSALRPREKIALALRRG